MMSALWKAVSVLVVLGCVGLCAGQTCAPKAWQVPSLSLGASIYPGNISYVAFYLPETAASNFNVSFNGNGLQNANITVYVGFGNDEANLTCPDANLNNGTQSGSYFRFQFDNPDVKYYFFGVAFEEGFDTGNMTHAWVISLLSVGCPDYCNGAGAMCDSQTGCVCMSNFYNKYTGCNVTGQCDPFANETNACTLPQFNNHGYGEQPCVFTNDTRMESAWGECTIVYCDAPYIVDVNSNMCASPSATTTGSSGSSSGGSTGKGKKSFTINLSKGTFIGIMVGAGVGLVLLTAVITRLITSRNHKYHQLR